MVGAILVIALVIFVDHKWANTRFAPTNKIKLETKNDRIQFYQSLLGAAG